MVYRFQFLNDLHALVQYQQQEIIKKEKPQVENQKTGSNFLLRKTPEKTLGGSR